MPADSKQYAALQQAVEGVLLDHFPVAGDRKDVGFHDQAAWCAREKTSGRKADLTMTFEGPVNHALNGYLPAGSLHEDLREALQALGFYYEMGYAWTLHVYPIKQEHEVNHASQRSLFQPALDHHPAG